MSAKCPIIPTMQSAKRGAETAPANMAVSGGDD
jgi:hypothetical protein